MQPSAATKEHQPANPAGENQIPVTHTELFDHELVANAKSELGDAVKTPAQNLGPIQNPEALRHLLEVVNDVKAAPTESLIGDAGVRKDLPEIPKKNTEPFPKIVASSISHLGEQVYHGYLKWKPSFRYNKSKDNLEKVKERSELLGQKLKVEEVLHAPKKTELSLEQPAATETVPPQAEEVARQLSAQGAPEQPTEVANAVVSQTQPETATPEHQPASQSTMAPVTDSINPVPEVPSEPLATPNETAESPIQTQPVANNTPVDLNAYRQTGQIVPTAEQPTPPQPQVPQPQAA